MAKISVMTLVFWEMLEDGRLTDQTLLDALEQAGFDGVELTLDRLLSRPPKIDLYADYLSWSKLEVTCLDAVSNLAASDPNARKEAVDFLRKGIEAASTLRCPLVLSAGSKLDNGTTPEEGRQRIVEGLLACQDAAREAGITLAIENFGLAPKLQCSAADCLEVLEAVPGLAFVFDTGNFYFAHEEPDTNFDRLLPYTRHVHLKDWVRTEVPEIADVSGAQLGEGLIPNEALIRRFTTAGIESFSLEVGAPGDRLEGAIRDINQVRNWLS